MVSRVRRPDLERDHGSPPAPPFIAYLGGGLLALGTLLAVLVAIDAWEGRRGNGEATLLLAGTLAIIATPFLLVARTMVRRNAQIWRNGRLAEATVTSVKEASVQISRYEEPRWMIDYTYRDASGVT